MSFKFIDKIGLEIEGGWDKSRGDLIADGSVHVQDFVTSPKCTGELVSQPFSDIGDAISFVMNNWPTESTKNFAAACERIELEVILNVIENVCL